MKRKQRNTQDKRYLNLKDHYEEYVEGIDSFNTSIFRNVYESLYRALDTIIMDADKKRGGIITILGKRGSGKTSTLLSFTKFLETEHMEKWKLKSRNVRFCVMKNLDASMPDSKEDLFDVLLSRMFRDIETRSQNETCDDAGESKRLYDISQVFDDIYLAHQSIKKERYIDFPKGYSPLSALRNFPDSLNITDKFEKLVSDYLEIMLDNRGEGIGNYLVVPIDDLDMNGEKGFESLEQIYRYVAVKNVIVMITVKYEQIMFLAEKNGYKIFPMLRRELEDSKVEYVGGYAREYLEKLLPIQTRVHMPDIMTDQYEIQDQWYIKDEKHNYTMKEGILFKICEKTGMYFDICGKKRHFLMPESLRELKSYYGYLEGQLEGSAYSNIECFINDFLNRIIDKKLSSEYREEIWSLCRLSDRSINDRLTLYVKEKMRQYGQYYGYHYKEGYGELLRHLYQMSRMAQQDEQFVYAVLIFYTYLAKRNIIRLTNGSCKDKDNAMRKLFLNSWAGSWSDYMVPRIYDTELVDNREKTDLSLSDVLPKDELERKWGCVQGIRCSAAGIGRVWKAGKADSIQEWLDTYQKEIEELEWFLFLFEGFSSDNINEDMRFKISRKSDLRFEWRILNEKCDFNILAFIKNSYYYEEYFDKFYYAMARGIAECPDIKEKMPLEPKKWKERSKLYKAYQKWASYSKRVAVPFQYTDIYYHILRRIQNQSQNRISASVGSHRALSVLKELYTEIGKILEDEDKGYAKFGAANFARNFTTCPFIEALQDDTKDWNRMDEKEFGKLVNRCARSGINNRRDETFRDNLTTSDDMGLETYEW